MWALELFSGLLHLKRLLRKILSKLPIALSEDSFRAREKLGGGCGLFYRNGEKTG